MLYSKPGCVQCTATSRAMDDAGIEYDVVDVAEDDEALARIKALGYMAAPVVIAAGGREHWSGFRPDKRHNRISPKVLRDIEKAVGFVPDAWK